MDDIGLGTCVRILESESVLQEYYTGYLTDVGRL